nr:transmembrane domain containing protein [Marseillevirus futianmevirus]
MRLIFLTTEEKTKESHETVIVSLGSFKLNKFDQKKSVLHERFVYRAVESHDREIFPFLVGKFSQEFPEIGENSFCCGSITHATELFDVVLEKDRKLPELTQLLCIEEKQKILSKRIFFLEQTSQNLEILFIFLFFVATVLTFRIFTI